VAAREKILLYGDYDVDGVSSIVILRKMIELMGHHAEFHVPTASRTATACRSPWSSRPPATA
jgi:single-stranded DNA-specific DHH superfamily exonuclease